MASFLGRPHAGALSRYPVLAINRTPALFARWQMSVLDTLPPGSACVVRPVQLSPHTHGQRQGGSHPWRHSTSQPRCGGSAAAGAKLFGDALHAQMQLSAARAASALALVGLGDDSHGGLAEGPQSTLHVTGDMRGLIPDGAATEPAVELGCWDRP